MRPSRSLRSMTTVNATATASQTVDTACWDCQLPGTARCLPVLVGRDWKLTASQVVCCRVKLVGWLDLLRTLLYRDFLHMVKTPAVIIARHCGLGTVVPLSSTGDSIHFRSDSTILGRMPGVRPGMMAFWAVARRFSRCVVQLCGRVGWYSRSPSRGRVT